MGNTLTSAKLLFFFVVAVAVPWIVSGDEDQDGNTNAHTEATSDHAADGETYEHTAEIDTLGEDLAELEHLSELVDSRMPGSDEKLRLSVSADHPITSETHGYEERTFIDVSFARRGSLKPNHAASKTNLAHDENAVSHDKEDVHLETEPLSHQENTARAFGHGGEKLAEQEQPQLPFPHAAEGSYDELSDQLHDRTFDLIKAEIRGDPELIQSSIYEMTPLLQSIIDRASHPSSPQPSQEIDSIARGMAIHLDRIDFALSQENMRKVGLLVGKVAAKVKALEGIIEAEVRQNHGDAHAISDDGAHHNEHEAGSHDSHNGVHH